MMSRILTPLCFLAISSCVSTDEERAWELMMSKGCSADAAFQEVEAFNDYCRTQKENDRWHWWFERGPEIYELAEVPEEGEFEEMWMKRHRNKMHPGTDFCEDCAPQ